MDIANKKYSEKELREFISNKINNKNKNNAWGLISYYQDLSEEFIREFKDDVHWCNISYYQDLSEEFIREHKDRVSWYNISKKPELSKKFKYEMHDKMYIKEPIKNIKIKNPKEII